MKGNELKGEAKVDGLEFHISSEKERRWAYHVRAGPSNKKLYEEPNLRHSAPFCATGQHLDRKCASCRCGSPVPSKIFQSG